MKYKTHNSRKFLNNKHGLAAIQTSCDISGWAMDASVTISDCNRNITLDFSVYREKDYAEKAKKLALIINELVAVQSFMEANLDTFIEAKKKADLERKESLSKRKSTPLSQILEGLDD